VRVRGAPPPTFPQLDRLRAFKHLFESTGVAVIMYSPHGLVEQANPAAERLLGWPGGGLAGQKIQDLTLHEQSVASLDAVVEAGGHLMVETTLRRRSGAVFQAVQTVAVVSDPLGEPLGLVSLIEDDTPNRRRQDRLNGLMRLGASLNAERDPDALLSRVCRDARLLFGAHGALLGRLDERTGDLVFVAADGPGRERLIGARRSPEHQTTVTLRALASRKPEIQRYESEADTPDYARAFQTKCTLAVPLLREDRLLGVLTLADNREPDRFGPEEMDHARVFAQLAAVALEDARLHEAERIENERWLTLAGVSHLLTERLQERAVLEAVAEGACQVLAVDEVRVWLLAGPEGPFHLVHTHPRRSDQRPTVHSYLDSRMGQVLQTGRPWQAERLAEADPEHWTQTLKDGLRSTLVVPLIAGDWRLGCLTILSREHRYFDQDDLALACAFADQAALAVKNAQVFKPHSQSGRVASLLQRAQRLSASDQQRIRALLDSAERLVRLADRP
jgi:PAS domain S-box-containing protein